MGNLAIKFNIKLTAGIKHDKDADVFVSYAPAIGVYSQGETELQAKRALKDAIRLFLIASYKNGVLEQILKNAGFADIKSAEELRGSGIDYISVEEVEESILEKNDFDDVFEVSTSLDLATVG